MLGVGDLGLRLSLGLLGRHDVFVALLGLLEVRRRLGVGGAGGLVCGLLLGELGLDRLIRLERGLLVRGRLGVGRAPQPLRIMTRGETITQTEFETMRDVIYREVYRVDTEASDGLLFLSCQKK